MTLAELRALIRLTVANESRWPDAALDQWIAAGVRLYGAHFGERAVPVADADPVDVPATHLEALTAYVDYAARGQMLMQAAAESGGSSITVGQLSDLERRGWNRLKDVLDQFVAVTVTVGEAAAWPDAGL